MSNLRELYSYTRGVNESLRYRIHVTLDGSNDIGNDQENTKAAGMPVENAIEHYINSLPTSRPCCSKLWSDLYPLIWIENAVIKVKWRSMYVLEEF